MEATESDSPVWRMQPEDMWFSMGWNNQGPYRYDGHKLYQLEFPKNEMEDKLYAKYPDISFNPYGIYSIFKDSRENVWFGTSNLGIYHYDGNRISWMYEEQLTNTPEGGAFGIRSIAEDNDGYIWICNADYKYKLVTEDKEIDGLNRLKYIRKDGIKSNTNKTMYFLSMATDTLGDIWMLTYDNGIWRNTGEELVHYPIKDGEKKILLANIHRDRDGKLWVATHENGAYRYNGEDFEKFEIN